MCNLDFIRRINNIKPSILIQVNNTSKNLNFRNEHTHSKTTNNKWTESGGMLRKHSLPCLQKQ